jgi:cytochrome c oxidase subunit II
VRAPRLIGAALTAAALTLVAAACSGPASTLNTAGPGAWRSMVLWWVMFGVSAFVLLVVLTLLGRGLFRRRRVDEDTTAESGGGRYLFLWGVVFPAVVLLVLFIATLVVLRAQAREDDASHAFTVDVIAHRWWWELRYDDQGFTTANELHVPTGQPVLVRVTSADVIHSLWVPQLQRKMDAIPGRINIVTLQADHDGVYRGECAEFCGLEHARMRFVVVSQPQSQFDAWVHDQQTVPAAPTDATIRQGQQVFLGSSCVYCHTIRGTNASGTIGPDLTHIASRLELAAGSVPNVPGYLQGWIMDPQSIKPGTQMPASPLTPQEAHDLIAYLESLR